MFLSLHKDKIFSDMCSVGVIPHYTISRLDPKVIFFGGVGVSFPSARPKLLAFSCTRTRYVSAVRVSYIVSYLRLLVSVSTLRLSVSVTLLRLFVYVSQLTEMHKRLTLTAMHIRNKTNRND